MYSNNDVASEAKDHAIKMYGGVEVKIHVFLTSALGH
jgi:hypothetical protein